MYMVPHQFLFAPPTVGTKDFFTRSRIRILMETRQEVMTMKLAILFRRRLNFGIQLKIVWQNLRERSGGEGV